MEFVMKKPCPDEEKLAEYLEGHLPEEDRYVMEEHLSECRVCLEGIIVTNNLIRHKERFELESVPAEVTESSVRSVTGRNSLFSGILTNKLEGTVKNIGLKIADVLGLYPWEKYHPALIRSSKRVMSENFVSMGVPFKNIKTEIEIEKTEAGKASIRVMLPKANKSIKPIRITLEKGNREVTSYLLDGDYVLFEDIPFGRYGISLAEDGIKLGTYLFEINGNRHDRK
jgi:hypothetical protein